MTCTCKWFTLISGLRGSLQYLGRGYYFNDQIWYLLLIFEKIQIIWLAPKIFKCTHITEIDDKKNLYSHKKIFDLDCITDFPFNAFFMPILQFPSILAQKTLGKVTKDESPEIVQNSQTMEMFMQLHTSN